MTPRMLRLLASGLGAFLPSDFCCRFWPCRTSIVVKLTCRLSGWSFASRSAQTSHSTSGLSLHLDAFGPNLKLPPLPNRGAQIDLTPFVWSETADEVRRASGASPQRTLDAHAPGARNREPQKRTATWHSLAGVAERQIANCAATFRPGRDLFGLQRPTRFDIV